MTTVVDAICLDAVAPLERIKLTSELASITKQVSAATTPIERVKSAKRMSEIIALLTGDDGLSDDPNSPNYRYKDTGYIADSRKELAQSMIFNARKTGQRVRATDIDWNAIEDNPRQAAELVTKANLFGKTDWSELEGSGMEPGAGFLIEKIYAAIGKEPAEAPKPITGRLGSDTLEQVRALEETPLGRKDYAYGLETIRDRLENKKTVAEVMDVVEEIRDELGGVQLGSDEADQYRKLSEQVQALHVERRTLGDSSNDVYARHQTASSSVWPLERDIANREKRGWKPDPEKEKLLADTKAQAAALWEEFTAIRNDVNPKIEALETQIKTIGEEMRGIVSAARRRNLRTNPATRAWLTFGERFLKLVNYRSFRGSDSFAGHVTNAKAGKIKDWSWADKERPTKVKGATASEIRFQMKVADSYQRKGGKDIAVNSTAELKEMLGFREVQSGNWVLKDPNSAKFHVEQTAAAMSDMADMLGIDMKLLGYGGRLGMAFGARGTGGKNAARAHYEPVHRVINLTKMGGGGSLGHEWFHSMDNIIHEMVNGKPGEKGQFISSNPALLPAGKLRESITGVYQSMHNGDVRTTAVHKYTGKDVRQAKLNVDRVTRNKLPLIIKAAGNPTKAVNEVNDYLNGYRENKKQRTAWTRIAVAYYHDGEAGDEETYTVKLNTGAFGSSFMAEAVVLDEGVMGKYWSQTEEMAARAFQAYLEDKLADADRRNDYLSAMADNKFYQDPLTGEDFKPFPEGEERKRLNAAFDKLFASIREERVFEKAVADDKLMDSIFGCDADGLDINALLDAVGDPVAKIRLSKEIAGLLAAQASAQPMEKIKIAQRLSVLIGELRDNNSDSTSMLNLDTYDLHNPETYTKNEKLATLARRVAEANWKKGELPLGDFKREVLAGKHPELVRAALQAQKAEQEAVNDKAIKSVQAAQSLTENADLPPGYSVELDGDAIVVKGPFDNDLHSRIKRAGGRWDGASGTNRRVWLVPKGKAKTLKTILGNWKRDNLEKLQEMAEREAASEEAKVAARAEAPSIPAGKHGPFSIADAGSRYIVTFRYNPDLVQEIKSTGSAKFNGMNKTWSVDKADSQKLLAIIDRAKDEASKAAAEAEAKRQADAATKAAGDAARKEEESLLGIKRVTYWAGRGGYGLPSVGESVKRGDELFVVTDISKGRYEQEASSFGGSDDAPYQHTVTLRKANEQEVNAHAEKEAGAKRRLAASRDIDRIGGEIRASGVLPASGKADGEILYDTFDIYGGGSRIVVGSDKIWFIRNNGMDGDDWSNNNIQTGGAGAIGWYVPHSDALEARIRAAVSDAALDSVSVIEALDMLDACCG